MYVCMYGLTLPHLSCCASLERLMERVWEWRWLVACRVTSSKEERMSPGVWWVSRDWEG